MDIPTDQLLVRRPITVKAVVTPRWKQEAQEQFQAQINQVDSPAAAVGGPGSNK